MAGDNQHFIPQFLQRGFASRKEGKTAYTWLYRSGEPPKEDRIRDIGAESQFYTEPGDTIVDDAITVAENKFGNLVNRLRTASFGPVLEPDIPQFVAHMEVRTRHLRQSFFEGASFVIEQLLNFISDTDAFVALIQQRMANDPALLRGSVVKELQKQRTRPRDVSAEINRHLKIARANMPAILEAQKPSIKYIAASLRELLPKEIGPAMKAGHIRALKKSIYPEARSGALDGFQFRLVEVPAPNLVLGDSGVFFRLHNKEIFRPFTEKGNEIAAVFLMLSPNRVLIGEHEQSPWNFHILKRQAIRCSLEYFIANEASAENTEFLAEIGLDAAMLTRSELEELAVESFFSLEKPDSD